MQSENRKSVKKSAVPPRAWQRMLSGRRLDLLNPSPLDIEIEDIAHGLARVARWNGQTIGNHAFSVAQHSLLVLAIACELKSDLLPEWKLAALLHDAPEYVVGDLISPFKAAIGFDYKSFETRLQQVVHIRFGLPPQLPKTIQNHIKKADQCAAYIEATRLAGFEESEAKKYFGSLRGLSPETITRICSIKPWPVSRAQSEFLSSFNSLHGKIR